jgi:hypothetical protein
MLRVLRISVAVLGSAVAAVALQAPSAASTVSAVAPADTCAFSTAGRKIGCVDDAGDCSLIYSWRKGEWVLMGQEFDEKDLSLPDATVAAKPARRGVWTVVSWPDRRRIGTVEATNGRLTRWRIKNRIGRVIATARGSNGAEIGMLILHYDRDVFC